MAVIDGTRSTPAQSTVKFSWADVGTGDTGDPVRINGRQGELGSVQFGGTFNGGTTAVLQVSNDGTTWATLADVQGTDISATAAGQFEFSTGALYIRPSVSSGTSDAVDVTVILRG